MSDTEGFRRSFGPHLPVDRKRGSQVTLAKGRWVKTYDPRLGVSMRAIKPRFGRYVTGGCSMGVLEEILQEATRRADLGQLLVLITHGNRYATRKVHCFEKKTQEHLGVIGVSESEVDLLKKYENLLKYELMFTEQYFSVKRMTCDKQTIASLFDRKSGGDRNGSSQIFQSTLNFFHSHMGPTKFRSIGIQAQLSKPQIRALNYPKIPVRLRNIEQIRRWQTLLAQENLIEKS